MKYNRSAILLLVICLLVINCKPLKQAANDKANAEKIERMLNSRRYKFIPRSIQPMKGRSMQISNYSLIIRGDTLISYLPYYGIAYSAEIGRSKGPLDFTATGFQYRTNKQKRNTNIRIKLEHLTSGAQEFFLNISPAGYATLNVRFSDRQPVSFSGEIIMD